MARSARIHIGYNVNGHHNGVWLPGNYAIRTIGDFKATPVATTSWGALELLYADWQMSYVAAVCKAAGAQFHDTHDQDNKSVLKLLNRIATVLMAHPEIEELRVPGVVFYGENEWSG